MIRFWRSLIRSSSFLRKEVFVIFRQPRLLITLVLGPFLILFLFGIGYRNEARALRTLFVAEANSPIAQQVEEYATTLGPQLIFAGVTDDEEAALNRLRRGEVDVVAVTPVNAMEKIRSNEPAVFSLYHREIDPFQVEYVNYFGQIYIDEVNRRALMAIAQEGQMDASNVQDDLAEARQNASTLREALQAGDESAAQQKRASLRGNLDAVSLAVGASLGLLSGVEQTLGPSDNPGQVSELLNTLSSASEKTESLGGMDGEPQDKDQQIQRVTEIEEDLETLESRLDEFTSISPDVLVRPFRSEAQSIATIQPDAADFYTPAVIALLLQHLAVTFAALSIVRERTVGTMELFRVSPLSAGEALVGKYLSYMLFGALIMALLTLLLIYVLQVPMLGRWLDYVLVVAALLFTSLGIGFIISLVSSDESQAVQYTMIVLLLSVFFSGFLLSLDLIWQPVRLVSWAVPTTYGIILLRDIFLRGLPPNYQLLLTLFAIGAALFLLSWLLMRRLVTSR